MSTPSETMFTATIHGSRERRKASSFLCASTSVCRTTVGDAPVISLSAPATARACSESAVTTRPPASRCPPDADLEQLRVRGAEDPREAVGQLGRDRRPVAAAGLARGEHLAERRLDDVVAALPLQRPVVGDERDAAADPVAHRVRVRVGDVGHGDAVVVADARDRRLVGPERRAGQQQPALGLPEGDAEALAPREVLAEVVGLVGDHERPRAAGLRVLRRGHRHARVRERDALEVAGRAQAVRVGEQVQAEPRRRLGPLARQRRRRADHRDAARAAGPELLLGEHQRRVRLARAGRRRDEERALLPARHAVESQALPGAEGGAGGWHGDGQSARRPDVPRNPCSIGDRSREGVGGRQGGLQPSYGGAPA